MISLGSFLKILSFECCQIQYIESSSPTLSIWKRWGWRWSRGRALFHDTEQMAYEALFDLLFKVAMELGQDQKPRAPTVTQGSPAFLVCTRFYFQPPLAYHSIFVSFKKRLVFWLFHFYFLLTTPHSFPSDKTYYSFTLRFPQLCSWWFIYFLFK